MVTKYLHEYSPEEQVNYSKPVKRPRKYGNPMTTLRNLKAWCDKKEYVLSVEVVRDSYTGKKIQKTIYGDSIPEEWLDLVVTYFKSHYAIETSINGHTLSNSLPNIGIEVFQKLANDARQDVNKKVEELEKELQKMRTLDSEIESAISETEKNYNNYTPAQKETLILQLSRDVHRTYGGIYNYPKLFKITEML